jgi:hypothetical protein
VAKFSATDFDITIGSVDFSNSLAAVTLDITREQLEVTSFGNSARRYIAGLQDASVTLSFHQDFAAGSVDSTLLAPQILSTASTRLWSRPPHSAPMLAI